MKTRTHTTLLDHKIIKDGKTIIQNTKKETKVPLEPNYVKLYLDDLGKVMELQKGQRNLIDILLSKMEKNTLLIELSTGGKKKIAEELKTSIGTIDVYLGKLCKKEIIFREDTGLYKANPFLFGKGSWTDIYEVRLEIEYNRNGRVIRGKFKREE